MLGSQSTGEASYRWGKTEALSIKLKSHYLSAGSVFDCWLALRESDTDILLTLADLLLIRCHTTPNTSLSHMVRMVEIDYTNKNLNATCNVLVSCFMSWNGDEGAEEYFSVFLSVIKPFRGKKNSFWLAGPGSPVGVPMPSKARPCTPAQSCEIHIFRLQWIYFNWLISLYEL